MIKKKNTELPAQIPKTRLLWSKFFISPKFVSVYTNYQLTFVYPKIHVAILTFFTGLKLWFPKSNCRGLIILVVKRYYFIAKHIVIFSFDRKTNINQIMYIHFYLYIHHTYTCLTLDFAIEHGIALFFISPEVCQYYYIHMFDFCQYPKIHEPVDFRHIALK